MHELGITLESRASRYINRLEINNLPTFCSELKVNLHFTTNLQA